MNLNKCPYCEAEFQFRADGCDYFACLTVSFNQSDLCKERTAHKETAAALTHTKDDLASLTWQIEQCKKELTETRNKLAAAATKEQIEQIFEAVDKLEPYLSHNAHCFALHTNNLADCRCGLAERLKLIGYLRHKLNTQALS